MKTITIKLLIALLFLGVTFTSCDDDDDVIRGLEDRNIKIDDTQTFNMKNFAASFEQMFVSRERWEWDFTHEILNGKAVVTYQNNKLVGKFGDKFFTYVHTFNADGVITSTKRTFTNSIYWDDDSEMTFTYKFNTEGYIVQLTKIGYNSLDKAAKNSTNKSLDIINDEVRDIVDLIYNTKKQLITKQHQALEQDVKFSILNKDEIPEINNKISAGGNNEPWEENFAYDDEDRVVRYENSRWSDGQYYEYTYDTNGNMIKETNYYDGRTYTDHFEYDSSGRLTYRYYNDNRNEGYAFEYYEDFYREIDYDDRDGTRIIDDITDSSSFEIDIKRWDFDYDYNNNYQFEFCTTKEYFYIEGVNQRLVSKKEYFEGTPEDLVLVGYVTVDTRDAANEYKKTKESVYNANDTLLYYVTYEVSNNSIQSYRIYKADGTVIKDDEIDRQYTWIEELISSISMTPQ